MSVIVQCRLDRPATSGHIVTVASIPAPQAYIGAVVDGWTVRETGLSTRPVKIDERTVWSMRFGVHRPTEKAPVGARGGA